MNLHSQAQALRSPQRERIACCFIHSIPPPRIGAKLAQTTYKALPTVRSYRSVAVSVAEIATASLEESQSTTQSPREPARFPPPLPPLDESTYESACKFTPYANWIIPGHVMLGRYPYVEPSRCHTRDQGDSQLETIMHAGPTTFVCLQSEVPPQDQIRLAGVDGFLPYRAAAQLVAASMSEPPSMEEVGALRTPELDRFLPPRRRPANYPPRRLVATHFLHSPIIDLGLPEEEQLAQLLDELTGRLQKGEKLYIHCWGGRGRAGCVGATLLAKLYGMDANEALTRVQRAFDTRQDNERRSPETPEQHAFVQQFINDKI